MSNTVILKFWEPEEAIDEVDFSTLYIWLRAHGLPRGKLTEENGFKIGYLVGTPILVDLRPSTLQYLRIRVEIKVDEPLLTGFWLERANLPKKWINFRYERLAIFC